MRLLLPFLVVTSLASMVVIFPLGYRDMYNTSENSGPFNLFSNISSLRISENTNIDSGQWSLTRSGLDIQANGIVNPQNWAFLTITSVVNFPPLAGTQLAFSGSFSGLNLTFSAIRVSLVLTYLSHVVTIYYLVGDSSIPANTGSYSFYEIAIPSLGTSFTAHRDIVQDLANVSAGTDVGWEMRSISLGFVIYPTNSNNQIPIQVLFNSNRTALLSGTRTDSSYKSSYSPWYYLAPVLLLVVILTLYTAEPILRRARFLRINGCVGMLVESR